MYTPTTETGRRLRNLIVFQGLWPMPFTDVLPKSGLPRTGTRFFKVESEKAITDDLFPPFKMENHNEFSCQHSQNATDQSTECKRENSEIQNQSPGQMSTSNPYKRSK